MNFAATFIDLLL